MAIINWLNANQGVAMIVLNACYVVFTGLIIWEMRKERKERNQPNVIARIPPRVIGGMSVVELVIANIGDGIAKNISILLDQDIKDFNGKNVKDLDFMKDYPLLLPKEEMPHFINLGPKFYEENKIPEITGKIHFEDIYGKKRTNPINIKFSKDIAGIPEKTMDDLAREMGKLVKTAEEIARKLKT